MADIFISYSKEDREQARLLAAFLEAEGYSVWWDASLLSGENFRKLIMTELGRSRATIVIWTERSIHSDWVQSEAGRAHADRKLIPIKSKSLSYKDIPPPFDNMHIESADDREKILAAITAQLAKPDVQPSAFSLLARKTRFELLSWFGILGAVLTLTSNLQSVLTLGRWARQIFASWTSVVTYVWQKLLFFVPKVYKSDAIMLTLVAFAVVNMVVSSTRYADAAPARRTVRSLRVFSTAVAAAILSIVLYVGFGTAFYEELQASGPDMTDVGYYPFAVASTNIAALNVVRAIVGQGTTVVVVASLIALMAFIAIPLLPAVGLHLVLRRTTSFRLNGAALSARLWRVVAGVVLLVVLGYLSKWTE